MFIFFQQFELPYYLVNVVKLRTQAFFPSLDPQGDKVLGFPFIFNDEELLSFTIYDFYSIGKLRMLIFLDQISIFSFFLCSQMTEKYTRLII